jgi:hypothetical protein
MVDASQEGLCYAVPDSEIPWECCFDVLAAGSEQEVSLYKKL